MVVELSLARKKLLRAKTGERLTHVGWSYFWSKSERSSITGTNGSSGLGLHGSFQWSVIVKAKERDRPRVREGRGERK